MVETDLYFGLNKPDGTTITEQEWNLFEQNEVCAVFKQGSTVVNATGNWFNPVSNKLITEPTKVVICVHPKTTSFSKQIDSLRQRYKTVFRQQSVLRVDKKATVSF